jgi:hypothetical protein
MHKKPYTGNYRKRMSRQTGIHSGTGSPGGAGIGAMVPPIQSDAAQIAAPNKSSKKTGARNSRPNMRR